jgi:hypothetical protein
LCCQVGDLCLSNQICAATNDRKEFRYYRGACLDSKWTDPKCPNMCARPDRDDEVIPMHRCSGDKSGSKWYCGEDAPDDEDCKVIDGDVELPRTHLTPSRPMLSVCADEQDQRALLHMPQPASRQLRYLQRVQLKKAQPRREILPITYNPRWGSLAYHLRRGSPRQHRDQTYQTLKRRLRPMFRRQGQEFRQQGQTCRQQPLPTHRKRMAKPARPSQSQSESPWAHRS